MSDSTTTGLDLAPIRQRAASLPDAALRGPSIRRLVCTDVPALADEVERLRAALAAAAEERMAHLQDLAKAHHATRAAEAERDAALAVLRAVEWAGATEAGAPEGAGPCCPSCGAIPFGVDGVRLAGPHGDGCALAAALAAPQPATNTDEGVGGGPEGATGQPATGKGHSGGGST